LGLSAYNCGTVTRQGTSAVAIGAGAGYQNQGDYATALGWQAGNVNQAAGSIVISAGNVAINNTIVNSCCIYPIRNVNGTSSTRLYYGSAGGQNYELYWGTDPSSIRYKENVIDLPLRYIDGLLQLRPVEFSFKTSPNKRNIGFIAEEVNEIIPEVVVRNANDDTIIEGIDYEHLVAPLLKLIQNLTKRVQDLEDVVKRNNLI
jgi:hypothetical protein